MEWRIEIVCIIILLFQIVLNTTVTTSIFVFCILEWKKKDNNPGNTIVEAKVTFSPISVEDKRILYDKQTDFDISSERKAEETSKETVKSLEVLVQEKNEAKTNETIQRNAAKSSSGVLQKWHTESNAIIEKGGYGAWINLEWKRIGTGEGPREIGDKTTLKEGNGNICIIQWGEKFLGVPAKAQWKDYNFKMGAYRECYCMPEAIERDCDYEITKIKECAILSKEKDTFRVLRKGSIEVKKL